MFPDLELAVEEDVPELAISFFDMVRTWVGELITLVNTTQKGNQTSINQVKYGCGMLNVYVYDT